MNADKRRNISIPDSFANVCSSRYHPASCSGGIHMKSSALCSVFAALILSLMFGCDANVSVGGSTHISATPGFNVRDFGAAGDGKALDSPAINKTIDAVAAAGGGTVYFPPGTYRCFSIRLKSNICLYLDQAATILAAENPLEENAPGYDAPSQISAIPTKILATAIGTTA